MPPRLGSVCGTIPLPSLGGVPGLPLSAGGPEGHWARLSLRGSGRTGDPILLQLKRLLETAGKCDELSLTMDHDESCSKH